MRLVGRRTPRPQLFQREHQLHGVEEADHACQPRRRETAGETDELGPRHVDVDEPTRDLDIVEQRCLGGDVVVEPVPGDELVERVPFVLAASVELDHPAVLDHERG